jgi:hypothetical protein
MATLSEIKATLAKIGVKHVEPCESEEDDFVAFVHFEDMPKETKATRKVVQSLSFDIADKGLLFK